MIRTLPAIVAFTLAATSAAWAQGARLGNAGSGPAVPNTFVGGSPLIGGAAAGITPGATPPPEGNTALGGGMAPGATPSPTPSPSNGVPGAANQPLQPGANSFSMGQAATRMRKRGFTNVTGLHRDRQGVWHGRAMHDGHPASVSLDYRGDVVGGQPGAAGREAGRTYQGEAR